MIATNILAAMLATAAPAEPTPTDIDETAMVGERGGVRYYDFDDDDIEGEVLSPEGANIMSRGNVRHASLIELRPHFIRELSRFALDL